MSSVLGLVGDSMLPIYSATKRAILGLTRSIAVAYAGQGIRCVAICPRRRGHRPRLGNISAGPPDPAGFRARVEREYPARRMAQPDEIARVALFLASDDASFVNGTYLLADGGILSRISGSVRGRAVRIVGLPGGV